MMTNPSKCARGGWVALWTTSTRTTAISSIASSASWTIPSTTSEELASRPRSAAEMGAVGAGYDLGDPTPGAKGRPRHAGRGADEVARAFHTSDKRLWRT